MAFFTDTDTFKEYLPVNQNLDIDTISPYFQPAIDDFLIPYLGPAIIADLESNVSSSASPYDVLIPKFRSALANFAFKKAIPFLEVNIGDSGITRTESQDYKTAYQGQVKRLEQSVLINGYNAMDQLMTLMGSVTYPLWPSAPGYVLHNEFLFKDAQHFSTYYPLLFKSITYYQIRPFQRKVQDFDVVANIGEDQFDDFMDEKFNAAKPAVYKKGLELLRKYISHLAVAYAVRGESVKLTHKGVQFQEDFPDTSSTKHAGLEQISMKVTSLTDTASSYLNKLIDLMNKNLDYFTAYRDDESIEKIDRGFSRSGEAGSGLWVG